MEQKSNQNHFLKYNLFDWLWLLELKKYNLNITSNEKILSLRQKQGNQYEISKNNLSDTQNSKYAHQTTLNIYLDIFYISFNQKTNRKFWINRKIFRTKYCFKVEIDFMSVGFRFKYNFFDFCRQICMLVWIDGKFYSKIYSWMGMQNKLKTKHRKIYKILWKLRFLSYFTLKAVRNDCHTQACCQHTHTHELCEFHR